MPGLLTEASKEDLRRAESQLVNELQQRAQQQLTGVSGPSGVHIRDILPSEDLDADDTNNDNTWTDTNREWVQSGLAADQLNQVYEVDSDNRAEGKIIGIFALSSTASDILTTEVVFEDGTGSRFERLMYQEARTMTEGDFALLRNPVIFNEGKDGYIYQWADTAGADNLIYHGAVAEKAGKTLGTRSQTESAPAGTARQLQ